MGTTKNSPGCGCCGDVACPDTVCGESFDACGVDVNWLGDVGSDTYSPGTLTWTPLSSGDPDYDSDYTACITDIPDLPTVDGTWQVNTTQVVESSLLSYSFTCSTSLLGIPTTVDVEIDGVWQFKLLNKRLVSVVQLIVRKDNTTGDISFKYRCLGAGEWRITRHFVGQVVQTRALDGCVNSYDYLGTDVSGSTLFGSHADEPFSSAWIDAADCSEIFAPITLTSENLLNEIVGPSPSIGLPECVPSATKLLFRTINTFSSTCGEGANTNLGYWDAEAIPHAWTADSGYDSFTIELLPCV